MLGFTLFVAALFFCAGIGMWICLLAVRAAKLAGCGRQRRHRNLIRGAMAQLRIDRDEARMTDALRQADPAALIDIAWRLLPLCSPAERRAYSGVLVRRRVAAFMRRRMRRAPEASRLLYCELLGTLADEASIATLRQAVADSSPAVRIAAAIGLAERGQLLDLRAVLAKLGAAARRSSRLTFMFERLAAGRSDDVKDIARDSTLEPRVRLSAYVALIGASEANYRELVCEMALDGSPAIAGAAARVLGDGRHSKACELIEGLLTNNSPAVRREATEAAARLGDRRLMPALRLTLRDRDPIIHATAARSMARLMLSTSAVMGRLAGPADAFATSGMAAR